MYRNQHIMNQKGFNKVASEFDSLAVSNRSSAEFGGLDEETSDLLSAAIDKTANFATDEALEKEAGFANGLQMFTNVRRMIADKLGVSEGVAHDLSSNVITRSERIAEEYGGDQVQIMDGIVREMQGQVVENPDILGGAMDIHPIGHNNKTLQDKIKQRLVAEMGMNQRDAEVYKTLILKQSQDMVTMLRPNKRDDIAMAIVDVVVEGRDVTAIYDLKDNPVLMQAIKSQLGV